MASGTPTTNLGLRTMTDADAVDAQDINYNSGVLDTKIGAVGSTSLQGQINTINTNANRREVQKAVYAQLKDNGEPTTSTLTAYPTTAGVFRVGNKTNCPGLPTDSNGYGPLLIFNAGGYVLHVHKAANARMWYGTTENVISAPSSWIEIAQNSNLTFDTTITNLNDTSLAGGHYFYEASATGNPSTTAGRLIQIKSAASSWGGQIVVPNSSSFLMYARMKTSSGYGDWEQIATKSQVFNTTPYAGGSSSYEITCPTTINDGSNFFALLKHFGTTGVYYVDLVLLIRSSNNLYYSYITHNSSANITAASYSGNKITLTFNANVYMSAHVIATQ